MNPAARSASVAPPWMPCARSILPASSRARPPRAPRAPTPVMEQYIEIKAANPDCLLFYRMGDFYELFFEDAEVAARALGIVLTKRGKHLGRDIPMCGVPVHRADEYLQRLIAPAIASPSASSSRIRPRRRSAAARAWCAATSCAWSRPARYRGRAARRPAQQLSRLRSPARAQRRRREPVRARLDRHFDRRIPHCRARPRRARRRDRAPRAGRDHRVRCALRRSRACALSALAAAR